MFYKGKQYGTPYYGDIYVYMYDKKLAAEGRCEQSRRLPSTSSRRPRWK